MAGVTVTDLARAWASIDGKRDQFDIGAASNNIEAEGGHFVGYVCEAEEMLRRTTKYARARDSKGATMNLFVRQDFISAAGLPLTWKIECDSLATEDWQTIAFVCAQRLPAFGGVVGVPRGGLSLAREMERYVTNGPPLLVDDVWTTGQSMRAVARDYPGWFGLVAFARGILPDNVYSFMRVES